MEVKSLTPVKVSHFLLSSLTLIKQMAVKTKLKYWYDIANHSSKQIYSIDSKVYPMCCCMWHSSSYAVCIKKGELQHISFLILPPKPFSKPLSNSVLNIFLVQFFFLCLDWNCYQLKINADSNMGTTGTLMSHMRDNRSAISKSIKKFSENIFVRMCVNFLNLFLMKSLPFHAFLGLYSYKF